MRPPRFEVDVQRGSDAGLDRELEAFLDACPTSFTQQTTSWREVLTGIGDDEACFFVCRREGAIAGLLPGYRFEGSRGAILTSVPQPGPLGGVAAPPGADRDAIVGALMTACFGFAKETGCDLVSVITNPFWPDHECYERVRRPDFALDNALLALDLERDVEPDGTLTNASTSVRRNLRVAKQAHLEIDETQSVENVDTWVAIHQARHREIGARPLPAELFHAVLEHVVAAGRARYFFVRAGDTGQMVSGGLYLCHGSVVDAYMPSMDSRFGELQPNTFLAAHTIAWARRSGYRYYNWQGSPPDGGVERFKRSFGSRAFDYRYLTWVTGDAQAFFEATVGELMEEYRYHYVLPFDQLLREPGARAEGARTSARRDAWNAMEPGE